MVTWTISEMESLALLSLLERAAAQAKTQPHPNGGTGMYTEVLHLIEGLKAATLPPVDVTLVCYADTNYDAHTGKFISSVKVGRGHTMHAQWEEVRNSELLGVVQVLEALLLLPPQKALVYLDSLSIVSCLERRSNLSKTKLKNAGKIYDRMLELLGETQSKGFDVIFHWLPRRKINSVLCIRN